MGTIALSADATCDMGEELRRKFNVDYMYYTIISNGKAYKDSIDIFPSDLFARFRENGSLPQTSAANVLEYREHFDKLLEDHDEVVHIGLGGAITASPKNAAIAAEDDPRVHVIDSCTCSSAVGLLVIAAREMIDAGQSAAEVAEEVANLRPCTQGSFVLDTLEFMAAGGRCSGTTALLSSMLNIKPCIYMNNTDGSLFVGKKYRGKQAKVVEHYINDRIDAFDDIKTDHVFVSHTEIDPQIAELAKSIVEERLAPKNLYETELSCNNSSHSGPGTLGLCFMTEEPHILTEDHTA